MKWVKRIAIVLAVLLIVPTVTLLVLDHRANAGVALAAVEINAPPDQVWTWLDDGDKLKQWVSWMVDVKYPDPQKAHGLGAKRVLVMKDENNGGMLMQIAETYTEYAPPSRMTARLPIPTGSSMRRRRTAWWIWAAGARAWKLARALTTWNGLPIYWSL